MSLSHTERAFAPSHDTGLLTGYSKKGPTTPSRAYLTYTPLRKTVNYQANCSFRPRARAAPADRTRRNTNQR